MFPSLENALCLQNGSLFRYQCSGQDTEGGAMKCFNSCLEIYPNVGAESLQQHCKDSFCGIQTQRDNSTCFTAEYLLQAQ